MTLRRSLLLLLLLLLPANDVQSDEGAWALLRQPGAIVLFRHANAPGTGDPPGFKLGNCSSQRNLDAEGRAEARAIGQAFRERNITVGLVLSSQWCRATETAELAFPGMLREEPAFNSFFANRADEPERTSRARGLLSRWQGPGVLVVVTHQVNISALAGIAPRPGEGIIMMVEQGGPTVRGRLLPPRRP